MDGGEQRLRGVEDLLDGALEAGAEELHGGDFVDDDEVGFVEGTFQAEGGHAVDVVDIYAVAADGWASGLVDVGEDHGGAGGDIYHLESDAAALVADLGGVEAADGVAAGAEFVHDFGDQGGFAAPRRAGDEEVVRHPSPLSPSFSH